MPDIEYDPPTVQIPTDLAFKIMDTLRQTHIYALLGTKNEHELGDDFKPHKWTGYEVEFAEESIANYKALLAEMTEQFDAAEAKNDSGV